MSSSISVETRAGDLVLPRRRLTVSEFHHMGQAGILTEDDRIELIEGALIEMVPIGSRHASVVDELNHRLTRVIPDIFRVRVQNPLRLSETNEPQPDLALVRARPDRYSRDHPGPEDAVLVIEVGDTTTDYDRQVKVPLYARAGISEVWLVDLTAGHIEYYRRPAPEGYAEVGHVAGDEVVCPVALPQVQLTLNELLP
jgi:Uma2 family endonuclease